MNIMIYITIYKFKLKAVTRATLICLYFRLKMKYNRIDGVMVSVLISNAVDRGFELRSGQTKDDKSE